RLLTGIRIADVVAEGPSDAAGLRPGDLITHLRDQATPEFEVLRSIVGGAAAGERLPVRVVRDGRLEEFTVTLGEMPAELLARQAAESITFQLGIMFSEGENGPVVTRVWPDFPADALGFERGDQIAAVGGRSVGQVIDVFIAFNEADLLAGATVPVVVRSGDDGQTVRTIDVKLDF
ncbi:MAG: PDZ domain-containing protein, partial [Planctomycetota bacterium]